MTGWRKRQVMEMALEALEELNSTNSYWWQEVDEETLAKIDPAITAIKEALAQPEQDYPENFIHALAFHTAISDLEPEQEPVEWGVDWGKDGNSVSIIKRLANGNIEVLAWEYAPHPPQRTWVGLTANEVEEIFQKKLGYYPTIYAVEAKLKEKNT